MAFACRSCCRRRANVLFETFQSSAAAGTGKQFNSTDLLFFFTSGVGSVVRFVVLIIFGTVEVDFAPDRLFLQYASLI